MNILKSLKAKVAAGTALVVVGVQSASAALTVGQTAAFDGLSATVTDFETAAWGVVLVITVALLGIKIFKKFVNRAT